MLGPSLSTRKSLEYNPGAWESENMKSYRYIYIYFSHTDLTRDQFNYTGYLLFLLYFRWYRQAYQGGQPGGGAGWG